MRALKYDDKEHYYMNKGKARDDINEQIRKFLEDGGEIEEIECGLLSSDGVTSKTAKELKEGRKSAYKKRNGGKK